MPYRHGILHGVDLGYANALVAAKAWAALFAAGSYAKTLEASQAPKPEQASLLEALAGYAKTVARSEEFSRLTDKWKARTREEIERTLASPPDGTPEAAVIAFLTHWQKKNFGALARACVDSRNGNPNVLAGRIRKNLPISPARYRLLGVHGEAPAAAFVAVHLEWDDFIEDVNLRLLYYDDEEVLPSNSGRGNWFLAHLWPLEGACVGMEAARSADRS
jgi:hypothetical protein